MRDFLAVFHPCGKVLWEILATPPANTYQADTFGTFLSVRLIEVCKNCATFVNNFIKRLPAVLCVIKFYVVKEAR